MPEDAARNPQEEALTSLAGLLRHFYEELVVRGFSDDQAMELCETWMAN